MFLQQMLKSTLLSILLTVAIVSCRQAKAMTPSQTMAVAAGLSNSSEDSPESGAASGTEAGSAPMAESKRIAPDVPDDDEADSEMSDSETPVSDTHDSEADTIDNNELSEPSELLFQIQGALENGDLVTFQDGSLYDEYPLAGLAGQALMITLESDDFDCYLVVLNDSGEMIAQNDDIAHGGTNSSILVTLPKTDHYLIIASGFKDSSRGRYQLTIWTTPSSTSELDTSTNVAPNVQGFRPNAGRPHENSAIH